MGKFIEINYQFLLYFCPELSSSCCACNMQCANYFKLQHAIFNGFKGEKSITFGLLSAVIERTFLKLSCSSALSNENLLQNASPLQHDTMKK